MPADAHPNEPPTGLAQHWQAASAVIREEVSDVTFRIWIDPLEPVDLDGGTLYLRAPDHIRSWVVDRYGALLTRVARAQRIAAGVEVVPSGWQPPKRDLPDPRLSAGQADPDAGLNPRYTFQQFVICDGNRLAHAAALSVAEMPSQTYNPLFIHGRPGLGKTHLLHAIGNYVQAYGLGLTVRYTTVEEFTSEFVHAVRSNSTGQFRERFRRSDVLLIDDVQFLAEKLKTEEEFFHTFNALYEAGSQLVITSDRKPRDIDALADRLRERFEHGLVAELDPPDFDARMAILVKRARLDSLGGVPDSTLAEIARHVTSSVRTLEGALIRVVAYASLRGEQPTPELARQVLERLYPREDQGAYTLDQIQAAAAATFAVPLEALLAHDRRPKVAFARQIAMYLARELTSETLPAIGRGFGGRKHTTVLHAHRRIAADLATDEQTASAVDSLRLHLRAANADRP